MDLNMKIIAAVRDCPLLYKTNASLEDRQCGWQQLAETLNLEEHIIKNRWHLLRELFQRKIQSNSNFKYKREMDFLVPYTQRQDQTKDKEEEELPEYIVKPEFIITENDLENDSGGEEIAFLEVETLEEEHVNEQQIEEQLNQTKEEKQKTPLREVLESGISELNMKVKEDDNFQATSVKTQEQCQQTATEEIETQKEGSVTHLQQSEQNTNKEDNTNKENISNPLIVKATKTELKVETEIDIEADPPAAIAPKSTKNIEKENVTQPTLTTQNQHVLERCEDVIFGELVTAMLKRMDSEKKRMTKKEIMNLLLT